jgi:hypothetical protein
MYHLIGSLIHPSLNRLYPEAKPFAVDKKQMLGFEPWGGV